MKRKIFVSSLLACAVASPGVVHAQEAIEEIVVTGSFIKRQDSFDTANPIDVATDVDIAESGRPNLAEVIRNQPFNYGVDTVSNIIGASGQGGVTSQPNLRGLGTGATLTLLDGKRATTAITGGTSIQGLYPQLLIQRVETLTDGGAALYGTDAVGGVVNYIPKKSFDGFEIEAQYDTADGKDYDQATLGFITGGSGDTTNFVFAAQYRDRGRLTFADRPQYSAGGFSASQDAFPGTFRVPNRDDTGAIRTDALASGTSLSFANRADPGCDLNNQGSGDKSEPGGFSTGFLFGGVCRNEFGANFDYLGEQKTLNTAFLFENQISDTTTFNFEGLFSRNDFTNRGTPANPGGRFFELGVVPGEHPGNPYRAFYDARLPNPAYNPANPLSDQFLAPNGIYQPGSGDLLLFAQDSNGDGIPDRDGSGQVIVVGDETNPNGGIAFNEDVTIFGWRAAGYPCVNGFEGPSYFNDDCTGDAAGTGVTTQWRFSGGLDYEVSGTWTGFTDFTYHRSETDNPVIGQSLTALQNGVNGTLVVDGEQTWFNPFSTSWFDCTNRNCDGGIRQTDPDQLNSQREYDRVSFLENEITSSTLFALDSVATGDLFEGWAGTVQAAVGVQWRKEELESSQGATSEAGDLFIGGGSPSYGADRDTYALFGEVNLPLMDSDSLGILELSAAARFETVEDDSNADLDSDNYKLGMRWQFNDNIVTRASWGTAFIAPSLAQMFSPLTTGLSNVADPHLAAGAAFKSRTLGGNPELDPESADVWNLGFTLSFDEVLGGDLSWSVDYKYFDFEDRISRLLPTDVVNRDFAAYQLAGFTAGDAADVLAWTLDPRSDPNIIRDPLSGTLNRVITPLVNALSMEWKGFDTRLAYSIDTDFGSFRAVLAGTYVDEYIYQLSEETPEVNGAGVRNNGTGVVPATPRIRANFTLGWDYDIHTVVLTSRYNHHVIQDGTTCQLFPSAGSDFGNPTNVFIQNGLKATNGCDEELRSLAIWDLQYSATLEGLIGDDSQTRITLGALNMFDTDAEADASLGGLETQLYEPVGQQLYIRLNHSF